LRTTVSFLKQKWIAIMKLSTLLLSSAAVLVAGSAFAADLPAKKGAPAAKAAAGCLAFGAGFFQIPGGDTCIKFSGYARGEVSSSSGSTSTTPAARLIVDTRSNSEVGAVRGYIRANFSPASSSYTGGSTGASSADGDRAYAQVGGLTAGAYGSVADISGSQGNAFGSGLGGGSGVGLKYGFAAGATTITIAAENSVDRNTSSYSATNPDLMAALSMDVAGGSVTVVGVSHKNAVNQGYAYLGAASIPAGPVKVGVYGGASYGAVAYTGAINSALTNPQDLDVNSAGTSTTEGSNMGGWLSMAAGKGTAYIDYGYRTAKNGSASSNKAGLGVGYAYSVGGGITVTPEYLNTQTNNNGTTSTSNTVYLRIQRDF
jgi:hypothetical protein